MTRQIIPPDFYEWFLKKHPRIFIGCVLFFCFVIVPVVHVAVNKELFKRKAIEIKYCYHWDGDTIRPYKLYSKGKQVKCISIQKSVGNIWFNRLKFHSMKRIDLY